MAQTLWENIHMANFDAAGFEAVLDAVVAGWFALYIDEDKAEGRAALSQWLLAGVYCSASKPGGMVDSVYRCFTMTAEQAVDEFGENEVSEDTRSWRPTSPTRKSSSCAIYPHAEGGESAPREESAHCLGACRGEAEEDRPQSGYHEMPVVVPRWMLIPDSVYGCRPGLRRAARREDAQRAEAHGAGRADLAIAGMWIAEDDGVLNPRTVKVGPKKIIIANSVDSMKPLQTGANFELSEVLSDQLRRRSEGVDGRSAPAQDGPGRDGDRGARPGESDPATARPDLRPAASRIPAATDRSLLRLFTIAGAFGPLPIHRRARVLRPVHLPLAHAQKLEDVTAIERLRMNIAQIAQAKPEVLDLIDEDATVRVLSDAMGVPTRLCARLRR